MLDLQTELRHLAAAERHVREAKARLAQLDDLIAYAAALGESTTLARGVRATMRDVLASFVLHRDAIVLALNDLDPGRRPAWPRGRTTQADSPVSIARSTSAERSSSRARFS